VSSFTKGTNNETQTLAFLILHAHNLKKTPTGNNTSHMHND